jgi:maltooligosyltrehalose trehalohydrolase
MVESMDEVRLTPGAMLGAVPQAGGRCRFEVWAPSSERVGLVLDPGGDVERVVEMQPIACGYHIAVTEADPGTRYVYRLADGDAPDPASRWQPDGVHGPSAVFDADVFAWTDDAWTGLELGRYVSYELHVGTFTDDGTLDAATRRLDDLVELGVTAVEVMPIAQFSGANNWGYDGVFPFAVQDTYGGPEAFQRFVDACHGRGLAVVLDVVFNHLGPEGNVLPRFGPYLSPGHSTPWGDALNLDGPRADEVLRLVGENALRWFVEFHVDALRLDAVHAIVDTAARPLLGLLADATHDLAHRMGRRLYLVAEGPARDARLVRPRDEGGLGVHARWDDELHHSIHALLTGERDGYYAGHGRVIDVAAALRGDHVHHVPAERFVVFAQNHDQVGNRAKGERLISLAGVERAKLAAGLVLLSPYPPLLFMGEEYGETNPFLYFVSHSDPSLIEAVRVGRAEEFRHFASFVEPPDPHAQETFARSKLDRSQRERPAGRGIRGLYRELLRLRREEPALAGSREDLDVTCDEEARTLVLHRWHAGRHAVALFDLADDAAEIEATIPGGRWTRVLDSSEGRWGGPGERSPEDLAGGAVVAKVRAGAFALYVLDETA